MTASDATDWLSTLGAAELSCVVRSLPPAHAASLGCASRALAAAILCDDDAWRRRVADVWLVSLPRDAAATTPRSDGHLSLAPALAVYASYHARFASFGPDYARAKRSLNSVVAWATTHVPSLPPSLLPGATATDIEAMRVRLRLPQLPPCLVLWWQLCGGQSTGGLRRAGRRAGAGYVGGYSVYDHSVDAALIPWDQALELSLQRREREQKQNSVVLTSLLTRDVRSSHGAFIPLAASLGSGRVVSVHLATGRVHAGTHRGPARTLVNRVDAAGRAVVPDQAGGGSDLIDWLEAHAAMITSGQMVADASPGGTPPDGAPRPGGASGGGGGGGGGGGAISLFPAAPPRLVSRVSRCAVRVAASSLWMPEISDPSRDAFAYRVRFYLLSIEEQHAEHAKQAVRSGEAGAGVGGGGGSGCGSGVVPPPARVMRSCTLRARRWLITDAAGRVDEVRGEGVIGMHPTLLPGAPEFVVRSFAELLLCVALTRCDQYQSMSYMTRPIPLSPATRQMLAHRVAAGGGDDAGLGHAAEPRATMRGAFEFVDDATGEAFDAECDPFELTIPEFSF